MAWCWLPHTLIKLLRAAEPLLQCVSLHPLTVHQVVLQVNVVGDRGQHTSLARTTQASNILQQATAADWVRA
jgi:hypothetical protein